MKDACQGEGTKTSRIAAFVIAKGRRREGGRKRKEKRTERKGKKWRKRRDERNGEGGSRGDTLHLDNRAVG